jgi:hypothetical protein
MAMVMWCRCVDPTWQPLIHFLVCRRLPHLSHPHLRLCNWWSRCFSPLRQRTSWAAQGTSHSHSVHLNLDVAMRVRACSGARPNIKLRGRNSVQGVDLHLSILCPQGVTSTLVSSAHKMFGDLPEHFWGKKKSCTNFLTLFHFNALIMVDSCRPGWWHLCAPSSLVYYSTPCYNMNRNNVGGDNYSNGRCNI